MPSIGEVSVQYTSENKSTLVQDVKRDIAKVLAIIKQFERDGKLQIKVDTNSLNKVGSELSKNIKKAESSVNDLKNSASGIDEVGNKAEKASRKVNNLAKTAQSASRNLKKIGGSLTGLGGKIGAITAPLTLGLGASIKEFVSFEDQLADVRKTSGLTAEETNKLGKEIRALSGDTRTTLDSLIATATAGGRAGLTIKKLGENDVAGAREDLLNFVKAVNIFNVALGEDFAGGAEEATTEVSKLRNLLTDFKTEDTAQDITFLGNAINELTNQGQITAPVLTEMAKRIAASKGQAKLAAPDILALAASLEDTGLSAERGGSAVGRILSVILKDVQGFSKIAGKSVKEFSEILNTDTNEGLRLVVKGFKDANLSTVEFGNRLDELNLTADGNKAVITSLISNYDSWVKLQGVSNKAIKEGTGLINEYNIKNNNTAGTLSKFQNNVKVLGILVGETLAPVLLKLTDRLIFIIKKFEQLDPAVRNIIIGVGLFTVAIAPLLIGLGALISSVGTIVGVLGAVSAPVVAIVGSVVALSAAFVILANRFGLVDKIFNGLEKFSNKAKTTIENIKKALEDPEVQNTLKKLQESFNKSVDALQPIFDSLEKLFDTLFGDLVEGDEFFTTEQLINGLIVVMETLVGVFEKAEPVIKTVADFIGKKIDNFGKKFEENRERVEKFIKAFEESDVKKNFEELGIAGQKLLDVLQPVFDLFKKPEEISATGDVLGGLVEPTEEAGSGFDTLFAILAGGINIMTKITEGITFLIEKGNEMGVFFDELPQRIEGGLNSFFFKVSETWRKVRNFIIAKTIEGVDGVVTAFSEAPQKVGEELNELKKKVTSFFTNLSSKAFNWGKNLIQNLINGLRSISVSSVIGGIVERATNRSRGGVINRARGGLVPRRNFANGGNVLSPRGSDSVNTRLTPGERVLTVNQTRGFDRVIGALSGLRNATSGTSKQLEDAINVSIANVNAFDSDMAKRRGGDIGFGMIGQLKSGGWM